MHCWHDSLWDGGVLADASLVLKIIVSQHIVACWWHVSSVRFSRCIGGIGTFTTLYQTGSFSRLQLYENNIVITMQILLGPNSKKKGFCVFVLFKLTKSKD